MKSWINQKKVIKTNNLRDIEHIIDSSYEKICNVPGLKTSLYEHQKTVVKAMLDLEMNRVSNITSRNKCYELKTSAGVLSEAVGSGKTIDILSVILIQKIPKVYPDITELCLFNIKKRNCGTPMNIIRKKFRNILKPTIVFVGVSVINQWVNAVKTFTDLKCFTVFDVRGLQKLINMMDDRSINKYDIVIVKNGKVTRIVKLPSYIKIENKNLKKSIISIYNIISNMRNICWARVVIDDFDTIKLPSNAGVVNGLFTWYISSTTKYTNDKYDNNTDYKTTSDLLMYNNYSCRNIMNNTILFYNLNIRNHKDFVSATNNICSPKFYIYTFENPNNQYIGLLGLIGGEEASDVMEMLNGDAVETAAERIGIKSTKVADIFQIMLGKQYDIYKKSVDVLEFIHEVEPLHGQRTPMSENPDSTDTYKKTDLFIKREIRYNYPNLKGLIDATKNEYSEIRQKSSISIERVKNNIKEGYCPICTSELADDEEEILILKCCGIILCGMCCFGTIFTKNSTEGQCSNCRSKIKLVDLIYLTSGFDLTKIVDEQIDYVDELDNSDKIDEQDVKIKHTKMTAIVGIIKGTPLDRKRIDINISNLMKGTCILPELPYRKVLIFANYEETLKKIKTTLTEEKISFFQLGGSHSEINNTVCKFTNCTETCVLIINSIKHCSGLNLQTSTDLIFAHKILDPNIETQVIGRGQRLGRKSTLKVHYLVYENEYRLMSTNNSIRNIPDTE